MTVIETARLRLRPFTMDDVEPYYQAILGDAQVMEFLPGGKPLPRPRAESFVRGLVDHWNEYGYGLWALIHRESGALIGHCGLQQVDYAAEPELAFALARGYWRQGLAQEAATAVLRYGFETLGLEKIIAVFVPENYASRAVLRKIGMSFDRNARVFGDRLPLYSQEQGFFLPDEDAPYQIVE
ncbi:MAG: GNAT family N-acetyltransferase [Anaerolineae bacterium]|nr:GNAT family N-acetyltransferase [Anaerolineae bacterium]